VAHPGEDSLMLEVFDHDTFTKDETMGGVKVPLTGLTMNEEKLETLPLSSKGTVTIGLTANGFDSSGMTHEQSEPEAVIQGKTLDPSHLPVFAPPPNYEIKDPEKFFPKQQIMIVNGWIQFFFNKTYYLPGETIAGRVVVCVTAPIQTNALKIKWSGTEKYFFEYRRKSNVENFRHNKVLFSADTVLAAIDGGVMAPGTHSFAFQFELPPGLAASFYERSGPAGIVGQRKKAAVSYQVKVYVDTPGSTIKAKERLIVCESVSQRVLPFAQNKVKNFAFASGQVQYTAEIGKDVYRPGDIVLVRVKVTNPTSKKVEDIRVILFQELTMQSRLVNLNQHERYTFSRGTWKFPGIEKETNGDMVLQIELPKDLRPTTSGPTIENAYTLVVALDFPMAFNLNVRPKLHIALLPAPGEPVLLFDKYHGGWTSW